jgi:hypothetical protein
MARERSFYESKQCILQSEKNTKRICNMPYYAENMVKNDYRTVRTAGTAAFFGWLIILAAISHPWMIR